MIRFIKNIFLLSMLAVAGCSDKPLNSPYGDTEDDKVFYSSFQERPKHLDPARSYS